MGMGMEMWGIWLGAVLMYRDMSQRHSDIFGCCNAMICDGTEWDGRGCSSAVACYG